MKLEKIIDIKKLNDWYNGSTNCNSCPFISICYSPDNEIPNCLVEMIRGVNN